MFDTVPIPFVTCRRWCPESYGAATGQAASSTVETASLTRGDCVAHAAILRTTAKGRPRERVVRVGNGPSGGSIVAIGSDDPVAPTSRHPVVRPVYGLAARDVIRRRAGCRPGIDRSYSVVDDAPTPPDRRNIDIQCSINIWNNSRCDSISLRTLDMAYPNVDARVRLDTWTRVVCYRATTVRIRRRGGDPG